MMPAALFVLGLGTLLYGLLPRIAESIFYALVLWSFLIEIIGSGITSTTCCSTPHCSPTSAPSPPPASTGPPSPYSPD